MKKLILTALILFSLVGCATKEEKRFYKDITKNSSRYESLRDTQKIILGDTKESESIILISYLRSSSNSCDKKERFIVSISSDDDNLIKSITLEGHKPISKIKISRDKLPKTIKQMVPKWFDSYLYTFMPTKLKRFRLIVDTLKYGQKSIYFYKDRRYIIEKRSSFKLL